MKFIKNLKTAALVALASLGLSIAVASPAAATESPPPTEECSGGSICGIPVTTHVVAIDLGAITFGQGMVQALAEGDHQETEAWVNKTSGIEIKGEIAGNACVANCATAQATGSAWEKLLTGGTAYATGTGESSAGVANLSEAGVGLLSRIRVGTANAPAP